MNSLSDYPKLIFDEQNALATIKEQLFETCEEKGNIELSFKVEINDTVDDNGKPKYSNEAKRDVQFNLMCRSDEKWKELNTRMITLLRQKELSTIKVEHLENQLKVQLALLGDKK